MATRSEAQRLKTLFKGIKTLEVTGVVDLQGKTPLEIAQLLPKFTDMSQDDSNPACGFLVANGRIFTLRSGLSPHVKETLNGLPFQSGLLTVDLADAAGGLWSQVGKPLAGHIEGQAAAVMLSEGITDAVLYINGSTPCLGPRGCRTNLPFLLEERARLIVYNKRGKSFPFVGTAQ